MLRGPRTPAGASAGNGSQFEVIVGPLRKGADHAASGHHPIETSRLGTHREHLRVRCSPCGGCPGKSELPEGKPFQPMTSASIGVENQLHTHDSSVFLMPRVFANSSEDLPCLLQRRDICNLYDAPRVVCVDDKCHYVRCRKN